MKIITLILILFTLNCFPIDVSITVDDLTAVGDLPPEYSAEIIANEMTSTFNRLKIPQVYGFVIGSTVNYKNQNSESFKVLSTWVKSGHPLGNHTFDHEGLSDLTSTNYIKQIQDVEPILKASGSKDWKVFRYPYLDEGNTLSKRNKVRDYLTNQGYKIAEVTIDFGDWAWNSAYSRCLNKKDKSKVDWLEKSYLQVSIARLKKAELISQLVFQKSIKHILLLHIGPFTNRMLEKLITKFRDEGIRFISLDEAMNDPLYTLDHHQTPQGGGLPFTHLWLNQKKLPLPQVNGSEFPEVELNKTCAP